MDSVNEHEPVPEDVTVELVHVVPVNPEVVSVNVMVPEGVLSPDAVSVTDAGETVAENIVGLLSAAVDGVKFKKFSVAGVTAWA